MGHRSCSLWPESARGRVMMALPVDVAGPRPRPGDVEAPPKLGSSLSSVAEAEPEPLGRARRRSFGRGQGGVRALGSGEAELPMAPEAGLGCCQPHSVEWHSSRSDAGGAVFLSHWSVERRSDCGHFGSVD